MISVTLDVRGMRRVEVVVRENRPGARRKVVTLGGGATQ